MAAGRGTGTGTAAAGLGVPAHLALTSAPEEAGSSGILRLTGMQLLYDRSRDTRQEVKALRQ